MGSSTENSAYQVDAQPLGPGAHPRRLQRRLGGGGGGLRGAAGAGHRHRRLDPPAGRACAASSASSRPTAACRASASSPSPARSTRSARSPTRRRRRPAAGSHRRPRPPRQHQRRSAGAAVHARRVEQPVKPLTIGVAREYFGEGLDAEVEQAVRAALEGLRGAGRDDQGDLAAAQPLRRGGLLPGGHGRGVEQPGPLRRRPLRPSRGEARQPDRHV